MFERPYTSPTAPVCDASTDNGDGWRYRFAHLDDGALLQDDLGTTLIVAAKFDWRDGAKLVVTSQLEVCRRAPNTTVRLLEVASRISS